MTGKVQRRIPVGCVNQHVCSVSQKILHDMAVGFARRGEQDRSDRFGLTPRGYWSRTRHCVLPSTNVDAERNRPRVASRKALPTPQTARSGLLLVSKLDHFQRRSYRLSSVLSGIPNSRSIHRIAVFQWCAIGRIIKVGMVVPIEGGR